MSSSRRFAVITIVSTASCLGASGCGDSGDGVPGGSGGSTPTAVGGAGGAGATSSTTSSGGAGGADVATCSTVGDFVGGVTTCRDEAERCTVTVPSTTSCGATCLAMGEECLRAYPEMASCVPAVEHGQVECDDVRSEPTFCQCGSLAATYSDWVVVTIGDSTMSNTGVPGESGWGDELPQFAVRPEDVHNQGSSGASSLDFETRPNWPAALALLGPNVFLVIQFGHNDTSSDPDRHTEPGDPPEYLGTYRDRLLFYTNAARAVGATPLIATSLGNMVFNPDGTAALSYMNDYVLAARRFAEDEDLILLDANRASRAEYERLGEEQTLALYSFDEATHFTPLGATRMAELTVRLGCVESEQFCAQFALP